MRGRGGEAGAVDLHAHSSASDGEASPTELAREAAAAGLIAVALTDHDTIAGVAEATRAAAPGLRVISGCEFSVAASWGEMHLLAYFLPLDDPGLERFLTIQRTRREGRGAEIVRRLHALGVEIPLDDVQAQARGGALGRPHVARALVARQLVRDIPDAFDRYLGPGRPAYVPKVLPTVTEVTGLVRALGGVSAAAHLKEHGTTTHLRELREAGVDAVEVLHPSHDAAARRRMRRAVSALGMLPTGGSDWHGEGLARHDRAALGAMNVPAEWLERLEALHGRRRRGQAAA